MISTPYILDYITSFRLVLVRSKRIREFNKKIFKNLITYTLYLNLFLFDYSEIITLILITNLD